jgi:hypothetical protein
MNHKQSKSTKERAKGNVYMLYLSTFIQFRKKINYHGRFYIIFNFQLDKHYQSRILRIG